MATKEIPGFAVISIVQYEGSDIEKIFIDRKEAVKYKNKLQRYHEKRPKCTNYSMEGWLKHKGLVDKWKAKHPAKHISDYFEVVEGFQVVIEVAE